MKNALISFAVVALSSRLCVATPYPLLQYDPATTKDCVDWINNPGDKTCKEVRDYFDLTPEEFAQWNPSVGVNCDKLWIVASYCILTHQKLSQLLATMTSTTTSSTIPITTTTSTTALRPSPTAWRELGCYADRPNRSILAKLVSDKDGDAALTIPKCQDTCYRLNYEYAGVKAGNQCWCSGYVAGEWTPHKTDCNMACTGDATKNCGGKDCLNVFGAVKPDPASRYTTSTGISTDISTDISTATSTHSATISTHTAGAAQPSEASSGAMKNIGFL